MDGVDEVMLSKKILSSALQSIRSRCCRPPEMGTNHAATLVQASFFLPGLGASLLLPGLGLQVGASLLSRLLSKCHVAILTAALLPAIVASYGPQLAAPLPPTFTFSNRSAYHMISQAIKQFLKMNKNIIF